MIRRFGEPVRPGRKYRRRAGMYAVLLRDGEVLLTHQAEPVPEVQLPGGGIDPGEQPMAALHREVLEETGWTISPVRRLGSYRRFTYMPEYDLWAEKLCTVVLAWPVRCVGSPREKGHTALWAPLATAARLVDTAGDRAMLAALIARGVPG